MSEDPKLTKPKIPQDGDSASPSAITVDAGTLAFVIFLALLLPLIISGFLFQ